MDDNVLLSERIRLFHKIHNHPEAAELWFERAMVKAELERQGSAVRNIANALQLNKSLAGRVKCEFSKYSGYPFVVDVLKMSRKRVLD
ncbi:hypothetical protein ABZT03_44015 [Streptomyces sp. NPDC005574]|uniref:hypothetical protein n=1 Tax=Streptomyces sp. NPDC005574 TaxID=3156891 RepID=UPI0033AEA418